MRRNPERKSENGSVLIVTAFSMVAIIAFAGLAVDVGNARYARRQLQGALDAAAVAAALEVSACGGLANCAAMQTAAQSAMTENGFSPANLATNCSGTSSSTLTLTINNPPCAQGASDPNSGNSNYVELVATETQKTYFGGIVGLSSFPIMVRAEAEKTPNPDCIFALDPSGGNAITVDVLAVVTASCGVMDESTAWNALSCNLIAYLNAPQVNVAGGTQGLLCLSGSTARTGAALPSSADPLSGLAKPTVPACGTSISSPYHGSAVPLSISGVATLYPDKSYCGGITILPAANVTFQPGTYVIQSGGLLGQQGGMTINLLANVMGTGVTFYNLGPKGGITFVAPVVNLGSVNLTAPTSGTYSCILFFQDPQDTAGAYIIGSPNWNTSINGAFYFPSTNVLYAASLSTSYTILVAKDIEFLALTAGSTSLISTFTNTSSSVPSSCPMSGGGSVLVQ